MATGSAEIRDFAGGGDRAEVLRHAFSAAVDYLEHVNNRPVAPLPENVARLQELCGPLPKTPTQPDAVLTLLEKYGSPATVANGSGRYFGFVNGGCVPAALAAGWMVNAWDQNAAMHVQSPAAVLLEETALEWVRTLLGLPEGVNGAVVTGATMASFCSLAAARHALLERAGWDVENDGLFAAPELTVVVGEEAHSSVIKGLGMLGLGRNRVVRVPVDGEGRMRADALPHLNDRTILVLQAGNVNTGAFDPLEPLIRAAKDGGAWVHVDGAFGLWATTAPSRASLAAGIAQADSWATDAHKWLNVPYDSGLAFVRDAQALPSAMAVTAEYLPSESPQRNSSDFTPEFSRRARGVEVWAALLALGRKGVAEMIERNCRQARRFAEALAAAGHRVLNDVVLNQVLASFGSPETTLRVIERIQEDGTCWAGSTVWQGHTAMRISVCSAATTDADVERSIEAMLAAGRSVQGS